ncbi:hypothetical protein BLA29_008011 [Euroglyphus maynei]|uniref:Uncharacterized protein n=1 Tax=Euroglyphus maynei TaxID=6958 RepID=A0A1Y3B233_EURMA|nr:hypothetical protein BLA29_008011 [Euroglyphus maynei]
MTKKIASNNNDNVDRMVLKVNY